MNKILALIPRVSSKVDVEESDIFYFFLNIRDKKKQIFLINILKEKTENKQNFEYFLFSEYVSLIFWGILLLSNFSYDYDLVFKEIIFKITSFICKF